MEPADSGQGPVKPPELSLELTPSSRGRPRKKHSKYLDYDTEDITANSKEKSPRRSSGRGGGGGGATPKKRGRKPKAATQQAQDGDKEATEQPASESVGEIAAEKPPEKTTTAKRTPAKKTPAKKTATAGGEGVDENAVQQENGTPKPKRKYVRRQPVKDVEPVTEEKDAEKPPTEPVEETTPGGRCRRGAAKAAMKYLQILAKEVLNRPNDDTDSQPAETPDSEQKTRGGKGRRGRKRKRHDSDAAEDEDFVPDAEEQDAVEQEEEEDDDEDEAEESDLDSDTGSYVKAPLFRNNKSNASPHGKSQNGLSATAMKTVWDSTETTKKFREEHFSSWVFPEWVPSNTDWEPVPQSDLETYLPQERHSVPFKVFREGLKDEETPLQTLNRFEALPAHSERWDMCLFAGGPVWALEWCPTPDGAPATQYVALACHRRMDDVHYTNQTCTEAGLIQLWDIGKLEYDCRPDSQPSLAYGLAQDSGFIWHLKWCPAGGWELPSCVRKPPFLPRLGLLAVATSNGEVTIYSLPHPEALHSNKKLPNSGPDSQNPPIYKAGGAVTLKLGAFKAPRHEMSGLVLSMDWLPEKPHDIMAVGFYDGVVGLWDLSTKSALLRVRESDRSLSLLPYRCLLAHDHAVRALAFCPASRHLLVTAGEDRYLKTWDLRRPFDPVTVQKRYLTNEVCWPLDAPGLLLAQENGYVPKGSQGVHYFDHNMRSLLVIPRIGTVWSLSYTEWINCVVTADSLGEVILSVLPQINTTPPYLKRTIERRFPIFLTSQVDRDAGGEESQGMGEVVEEEEEEQGGNVAEEQEGRGEPDAASGGGNENSDEGGRVTKDTCPPLSFQKYKEAVRTFCLQHTDNDLRTFTGSEKRPVWKRMKDTEVKAKINLDDMPLCALHKVRFNPNMSCHLWLASGGQAGLVRLVCLRSVTSSHVKKMISNNQAQFTSLYSCPDQHTEAVQAEPL